MPTSLIPALPDGVRTLTVQGSPLERRRMLLARPPGPTTPAVAELARALHRTAARKVSPRCPGAFMSGLSHFLTSRGIDQPP